MEVKICGLCRPEDAALAAAARAEYLGVVLAPGGARSRTVAEAAGIFAVGGDARRVGVFVDAPDTELIEAAIRLGLDVLQLHGREDPARIAALRARGKGRWRIWKAIRPRDRGEFLAGLDRYAAVTDGLLLDGWTAAAAGGAGVRFPWDEVAAVRAAVPPELRLIVAGGLDPDNVGEAVARLAPDVVDVSSGVERAVGEKAPERVRSFITMARAAAGAALPDARLEIDAPRS